MMMRITEIAQMPVAARKSGTVVGWRKMVVMQCCLLCLTTMTDALLFGAAPKSPLQVQTVAHKAAEKLMRSRRASRLISNALEKSAENQSPILPTETIVNGAADVTATSASPSAQPLNAVQSLLTRIGMLTFIAGMCIALPLTLYPQKLVYKLGGMTRAQKEHYALATGQFCARWMLRLVPFCRLSLYGHVHPNPPESVWVCNHSSMMDVFVLMAADRQLRGPTKRPIKIVYWKQLEKNPVTKLLFRQAGFIPVQMAANKAGEDNEYDKSSFKQLLKDCKQAFADGFDMGILPEGQLNPAPEQGLLPVFSGAFTLARLSKRPVQMMSLRGVHDLWHPVHGLHCVGRHVQIRVYPYLFRFGGSQAFVDTFKELVGHFALHGTDLPEQVQNDQILVGQNLRAEK